MKKTTPAKLLRIARSMTQLDLAQASGVHPSTIAKHEAGYTVADEVYASLAEALEVSPELLMGVQADGRQLARAVCKAYQPKGRRRGNTVRQQIVH